MHDGKHDGHDRGGSRHDDHGCDGDYPGRPAGDEGGSQHHHGGEARGRRGGGSDTDFLDLEISQVLYADAESVTRRAFRELLLEAAKERWRERFGDKITELAQLAVDELITDVLANLDIESHIQERNHERGHVRDRIREIFAEGPTEPEPKSREGGGKRRAKKR